MCWKGEQDDVLEASYWSKLAGVLVEMQRAFRTDNTKIIHSHFWGSRTFKNINLI